MMGIRGLLSRPERPFLLLHRPRATGIDAVEVFRGRCRRADSLSALGATAPHTAVLIPFRQVAERGFPVPDDGHPLVVLDADENYTLERSSVRDSLSDVELSVDKGRFDVDDREYRERVRRLIREEIGRGAGANFVHKRTWTTRLRGDRLLGAAKIFSNLMHRESGAWWTFLLHTGEATLVGASPERHLSVADGVATMNPISGTFRYPSGEPVLPGLLDFLSDTKETDELFMVLDEELKMMAQVCRGDMRIEGPYLRPMSRLAHTEYFISGPTDLGPTEVLRATMFAPTVTGGPLESACEVISRYEPEGRGYYSGALALLGRQPAGLSLDSSILIRTAHIEPSGAMRLSVGATIVRHSDPAAEAAETHAKAAGLRAAFSSAEPGVSAPDDVGALAAHPRVTAGLAGRNDRLAGYWRGDTAGAPRASGGRVAIIDAEDSFTAMLASQIRAHGHDTEIFQWDAAVSIPDGFDAVVLGPGPGDPTDGSAPKIARLLELGDRLLSNGTKLLAVCLGHQVLCRLLGLPLERLRQPHQGTQRTIRFFGRPSTVGFYNTFVARSMSDTITAPRLPEPVEVCRDPGTGEVFGLRARGMRSFQFHAESVLSPDGFRLIGEALAGLADTEAPARAAQPASVN